MRSLFPDSDYYGFLDERSDDVRVDIVAASSELMREFPCLKREEARAVFTDCRSRRNGRRQAIIATE